MADAKLSDPIAETVAALAHTPAGPRLSALLASLDLSSLTGSQCVDVLKARYRQGGHERGQLFAIVADPFMHPRSRLRERLSAALRPICEEISAGIGRVTDDSFAWPMPDAGDYVDRLRSWRRRLAPVPSLGDIS